MLAGRTCMKVRGRPVFHAKLGDRHAVSVHVFDDDPKRGPRQGRSPMRGFQNS